MPPTRPHMSITLPRNFTFHYTDGELPRTPELQSTQEATEPPQIPRQTYRIRRRRPEVTLNEPYRQIPSQDAPVPTIEVSSNFPSVRSFVPESTPEPTDGYLAPSSLARLISPPKTPLPQVALQTNVANHDEMSRPSTACSELSDSSVSSGDSKESFPSFGGSCTSPESEVADPFVFPKTPQAMEFSSPEIPQPRRRQSQPPKFTEEMDSHLWLTYVMYLQNPTVTPFKMLPGTAPPLGICHRVAREAKRTWKGGKQSTNARSKNSLRAQSYRSGSPDTIKPVESGNSTPTVLDPKVAVAWPRSSSATRKRLRELCKRKPSLSAHYQRLLHTRSPSPLRSSSSAVSRARSTSLQPSGLSVMDQDSSFSTRDMNISLATSTCTTMQEGNPLSELANEATPQHRNDNWFNQPVGRINAHQKSQSLQLGLGLDRGERQQGGIYALASPFKPKDGTAMCISPRPDLETPASRQLDPPLELHHPVPINRSFKRRAQYHLEDQARLSLNGHDMPQNLLNLFGMPAESSHRRVRSRGFSHGDVGDGGRRLSSLFTPPAPSEVPIFQPPAPVPVPSAQGNLALPQPTEEIRRLGSPFAERPSAKPFNTFPRNFSPSSFTFEPTTSFEERLGPFNPPNSRNDSFRHPQ